MGSSTAVASSLKSSVRTKSLHGYSPQYSLVPFTEFETVTRDTPLESLNLNWREQDLPERVRTKHVHRLHPYLGKFIPQIVEIFLRKFEPKTVCDPFCGSGTVLVEAASSGVNAVGCDISEFNTLMTEVKTAKYELDLLESEVHDAVTRALSKPALPLDEENISNLASDYLEAWFAPPALKSLLRYKALIGDYANSDVLRVILSRSARSARRTTHFELDFPKRPQSEPYRCYKHSRICTPTENAAQFLKRYSSDTLRRIKEFSATRRDIDLSIMTDDARKVEFPKHDLVITSPPYVGLIDYHEQHRYSFELLGLEWNAPQEIGPAARGSSLKARAEYVDSMVESFRNVKKSLARGGRMVVIVNDKLGLYDQIREGAGLRLESRLERHVNRRTGRRAGDFFESVLIWVAN